MAQIVTILMLQIMLTEPNSLGLYYFSLIILIVSNYWLIMLLIKNICDDHIEYILKKI